MTMKLKMIGLRVTLDDGGPFDERLKSNVRGTGDGSTIRPEDDEDKARKRRAKGKKTLGGGGPSGDQNAPGGPSGAGGDMGSM